MIIDGDQALRQRRFADISYSRRIVELGDVRSLLAELQSRTGVDSGDGATPIRDLLALLPGSKAR